ncbi:MAG: hypothetical protein KC609_20350 [Myxococcales bacterium]|nr:hypothetical protein [Myxococcales bacterium]
MRRRLHQILSICVLVSCLPFCAMAQQGKEQPKGTFTYDGLTYEFWGEGNTSWLRVQVDATTQYFWRIERDGGEWAVKLTEETIRTGSRTQINTWDDDVSPRQFIVTVLDPVQGNWTLTMYQWPNGIWSALFPNGDPGPPKDDKTQNPAPWWEAPGERPEPPMEAYLHAIMQ